MSQQVTAGPGEHCRLQVRQASRDLVDTEFGNRHVDRRTRIHPAGEGDQQLDDVPGPLVGSGVVDAEPEIDQVRAVAVDQDVGRPQVTMGDPAPVQQRHLPAHVGDQRPRQWSPRR